MRKLALTAVFAMAILHQDFWFWRDGTLVFGVIPVGLFYHACYTAGAAALMWLVARHCWPSHLEAGSQPPGNPGQERP